MKPLAILILAASLQAAAPKPPTIPDALAAKFWKAQVEMQRAQQQMQQADSVRRQLHAIYESGWRSGVCGGVESEEVGLA